MFDLNNCTKDMTSSINAYDQELKNIRTGRVSPDILKNIIIDSYGSKMPLTQLSNINNLDNMTLNVGIWDSSLVKLIEKSILDSNLGVNPQTDGNNILLKFPELTNERRKELVKIAKSEIEDAKISVRNARKDANNDIKKIDISTDQKAISEEDVQNLTDKYTSKIDSIFASKEKEILSV